MSIKCDRNLLDNLNMTSYLTAFLLFVAIAQSRALASNRPVLRRQSLLQVLGLPVFNSHMLRVCNSIPLLLILNCFSSFKSLIIYSGRSQWPRGLRCGIAVTRLLGFRVRILPEHGCLSLLSLVLSGRGLCDGQISRQEES